MTPRRHLWSLLAALVAFGILTIASGSYGLPALVAIGVLSAVSTALYFHYRRRQGRARAMPVTPDRDDRVIPQDVKMAVTLRDGGKCQIKGPPCVVTSTEFDHKIPHELGRQLEGPGQHPNGLWSLQSVEEQPLRGHPGW